MGEQVGEVKMLVVGPRIGGAVTTQSRVGHYSNRSIWEFFEEFVSEKESTIGTRVINTQPPSISFDAAFLFTSLGR